MTRSTGCWVVEHATTRIRFRYAGTSTAAAQVVDDASGTVLRSVTVGPEGTVLLDWLTTDRRLYGTNAHHDTTWTANDAGSVTATLRYDPWGNLLASSGSALPDWRFQTGHRRALPVAGRWPAWPRGSDCRQRECVRSSPAWSSPGG